MVKINVNYTAMCLLQSTRWIHGNCCIAISSITLQSQSLSMTPVDLRLTKILLSSFSKIKNPEIISLILTDYYRCGTSINKTNALNITIACQILFLKLHTSIFSILLPTLFV